MRFLHFLHFLLSLIVVFGFASGDDGDGDGAPESATCRLLDTFAPCTPNARTRDTAYTFYSNGTTVVSAYFYAEKQELWFTQELTKDAAVTVVLHSINDAPYVETLVYRDNIMAHEAQLRYAERDPRAVDTVHRWSVGTYTAGTTLWMRIQVVDWPPTDTDMERQFLLLRPKFVMEPVEDIVKPSSTCGNNCEARCAHWGGVDLERTTSGFAVAQCIDNTNSIIAACQCYCTDGIVGDVHGSASCNQDDGLKAGGIVGIIIAILLLLLLVTVPIWYSRKRASKSRSAPALDDDLATRKQTHNKDATETAGHTERHDEEEGLTQRAEQAPSWDALLSLPQADCLYTKVLQLSDGSVVVKRKFHLHQPDACGKTTKRLKVLFPDVETAVYHGFHLSSSTDGDKKENHHNSSMGEPTETTESESDAAAYIREVPSILEQKPEAV